MILEEKFRLSNVVEIPKLGLSTWFITNDDVVQTVLEATKIGYRHIDTAQAYRNESGVGTYRELWRSQQVCCVCR